MLDVLEEKPKTFFPRTSSGLVREFGTMDVLLMSSAAVFALVFAILQFPWYYGFNPGANLGLSLVFGAIPFLLLMLTYWAVGVIMPRSGNDYVWVARIMHPAVGFAWSFLYMFMVFTTAFCLSVFALASSVGGSLVVWGVLYNAPGLIDVGTWISSPTGSFFMSVVITLFFACLAIFGTKAVKRFLYIFWGIAVVGIIVMWSLLSSTNPAAFAAKWDGVLSQSMSYQGVADLATKQGWTLTAVTLAGSLAALPFAGLFELGGNFVNVMAGEIKETKKALPVALFLSLVFGILFWTITSTLTLSAVGENWMYAVAYLWDNAAGAYSNAVPYAPTLTMMLSLIAYPNQLLVAIVFATFALGSLPALFVYFWIPSRYFFAWSFDRIIPTKMAEVNKKYRTPHISVAVVTVFSILIFASIAFTTWGFMETLGSFLWEVCFIVPAIATIIFPYRKPELLAAAPGFMRKKIAGVPIISVLGALTAIAFAYMGYLVISNPLIVSPSGSAILFAVGIIVACLVVYYGSLYYHKRGGVDMEMAFKEIPPV